VAALTALAEELSHNQGSAGLAAAVAEHAGLHRLLSCLSTHAKQWTAAQALETLDTLVKLAREGCVGVAGVL